MCVCVCVCRRIIEEESKIPRSEKTDMKVIVGEQRFYSCDPLHAAGPEGSPPFSSETICLSVRLRDLGTDSRQNDRFRETVSLSPLLLPDRVTTFRAQYRLFRKNFFPVAAYGLRQSKFI